VVNKVQIFKNHGLNGSETMKNSKRFKSDAFAAIHETMEALQQINAIDKKTIRNFNKDCLTPVIEIPPQSIKELRNRENVSQPIFAAYLKVSKNLVSDWERGIKIPGGPALRLLSVIKKHGLKILT